jgi:tetratricopeptide (TPR) repeat protein
MGKVEEASKHFNEAITLYRQEVDNLGLANAYRSLGDLEDSLEKNNEARNYYHEAIKLFQNVKYNYGLAFVYSNLASVYNKIGDLKARDRYIIQAQKAAGASKTTVANQYVSRAKENFKKSLK